MNAPGRVEPRTGGEAGQAVEPTQTSAPKGWRKPAKIGLAALGVFLVFASGWGGPNVEVARTALDAGLQAHYRGDLFGARRQYLEVLKVDPSNKYANFNLGLVAHKLDRKGEATRYYEASLKSDPFFLPAMFNLAILKTSRGENEAAAELYQQIIEVHPDRAEPYFNLGVLLVDHLDRPVDGEAYIRKAVEMAPELASRVRQGIALGSVSRESTPQGRESPNP